MSGTDYSFVERELERGGYFTDVERGAALSASVIKLFETLDAADLDLEERDVAAKLFSSLVERDGDLGIRTSHRGEWKQFYLGQYQYGATVRVKTDAYDSLSGSRHNGLVGTFAATRAGRCMIVYYGRKDGTGHEHHPSKLEVLLK
jgi:hypothetical protein